MVPLWRKMNGMYKLLLSYFLILIIPIAIGSYVHHQTLQVIEEDSKQSGLAMLDQTGKIVDEQLNFIVGIANRLTVNSNVLRFTIVPKQLTDHNYVQINELAKEVTSQQYLNAYIKDILLVYKNSETIVTARGTYHGSEEYESFIKYGSLSYDQWTKEMTAPGYTFHKPEYVHYKTGQEETIALSVPIGLIGGKNADASVIIYIDMAKIRNLLLPATSMSGGRAFAENTAGGIVVDTDPGAKLPFSEVLPTKQGEYRSIDSVKYYVISSESDVFGWRYFLVTPEKVFLQKVDYVRQTIWIITIISLLAGAIVALYLTYRNRRPIIRLMKELTMTGQEHSPQEGNEFEFILNAYRQISTSHNDLRTIMEQQLPVLENVYIEKIMRGEFKSEEEAITFAAHAKLLFNGKSFVWIVVRIVKYDGAISEAIVQELHLNKFIVKNLANDLIGPTIYAHDLSEDSVALLLISPESETECEKRLDIGLSHLLGYTTNKFKMNIRLTVGSTQPQISESWKSFYEAIGASDYAALNQVLWADLLEMSNEYYFPLEIENKLVHTVKSGEELALDSLLKHIYDGNFQQRKLSVESKQQLIMELRGTVYKIIGQIQQNDQMLKGKIESDLAQVDLMDANQSFDKLTDIFSHLRHYCNKLKKEQNYEIIHSMLDYVNRQYNDPSLSLTTLATHFGLTENYISYLFKDRTQYNFSTYLENIRMVKACELLETTKLSIQDIAFQVGYNNDKSFRRAFKRVKGLQPTGYREQS